MLSCNACIFIMELVSKGSPQWSVFEWKHYYSAIDFTLFMHFPGGSLSRASIAAVSNLLRGVY